MFVLKDPRHIKTDEESVTLYNQIDWEFAQSEIASGKGFEKSPGSSVGGITNELREQIMELLPMVSEANAIADRLGKQRSFEIMILSGYATPSLGYSIEGFAGPCFIFMEWFPWFLLLCVSFHTHAVIFFLRMLVKLMELWFDTMGCRPAAGLPPTEAKVMVKMINLQSGNRWMLSSNNFIDRRYMMQALMRKDEQEQDEDLDDDDDDDDADTPDPFYHSPSFVIVGCATCFLDSLSYNIEFDEKVNIVDYKGRNEGQIHVSVYPCQYDSNERLGEDDVNEEPESQVGLAMNLELKVHSVAGVRKTDRLKVTFKDPYDNADFETGELKDNGSFSWDFIHHIKVAKVDAAFLKFLQEGSLSLFVKTWQSDEHPTGMARESTMVKRKSQAPRGIGNIEGMGGGADPKELEEHKAKAQLYKTDLEQWRKDLVTIVKDYRDGNRDALNISLAIDAILDGSPIPVSAVPPSALGTHTHQSHTVLSA